MLLVEEVRKKLSDDQLVVYVYRVKGQPSNMRGDKGGSRILWRRGPEPRSLRVNP